MPESAEHHESANPAESMPQNTAQPPQTYGEADTAAQSAASPVQGHAATTSPTGWLADTTGEIPAGKPRVVSSGPITPSAAPGWLVRLTGGDSRLLQDAMALLAVANSPAHGAGAPQVFEAFAECLEALHRREGNELADMWARTVRQLVAANHKLAATDGHVNRPTSRERERPVWGALLRLAEMARSADGLHPGAACVAGHFVLAQLRRIRAANEEASSFKPLPSKTAARVVACAQACTPGSESKTATEWQTFANVEHFTAATVVKVAANTPIGEIRLLASALVRALDQQSRTETPASKQVTRIVEGKAVSEVPSRTNRRTNKPRKEHPTAAGLMKTASFACMAEAFCVDRYWHWLAPTELKPVTRKLANALHDGRAEDETTDFALLALVSLLVSHDHRCTLRLSLVRNDDIWFCPVLGCVYVDRGILLGLSGPRGTHGYVLVVFPRLVVRTMRKRMAQRPEATDLAGLMHRIPDDAWLSEAEQFVCGLGDPSHPPRSARLSHSLATAFIATGASRPVAAQQTLNWAVGADSTPNYYGIPAKVANEAAARAFHLLELGPPEDLPADMWSGRPDVPADEDIRCAWQGCGEPVRRALEQLPDCQTVATCLACFNPAMVACWRALSLADGGRPTRPDRPTLADTLVHPRWYRRDDKDSEERSSARPLLRTEAAADVISATVALRQLLVRQLRDIGLSEDQLPRSLVDAKHSASLFFEVAWKASGTDRLVARAFSEQLLANHKAAWTGPPNLGRVFWVSEAVVAHEEWTALLVTGHGRSLAHPGTVALSRPVMRLLEDYVPFVQNTLKRLDLPRFAGGMHPSTALQPPQLDLSFLDRRAEVKSKPRDIPGHHVDADTLPALVIVDACIAQLGQASGIPKAARVLMALVCASGLVHSDDVIGAWRALTSADASPAAGWMEWRRPSKQIIRMPKQPQTWISTALCGELPPLAQAEAELRTWLVQQFPSVRWPTRENAIVTALCYVAARWIRLHVPPFLLEAFRPELAAATFDGPSNTRLCDVGARRELGLMDMPRPRQSLRQTDASGSGELQQVIAMMRKHIPRNRKLGGPEKRARRIGALLHARFDLDQLSPMAAMVVTWLRGEAGRWKPPAPGRAVPGTWTEYLRRMLPVLLKAEAERRDPMAFSPADWRHLGQAILDTSDVDDPAKRAQVHLERRHALARMAVLLAREPDYPDALAMLGSKFSTGKPPSYRPSRASVLVTGFDVEVCARLLRTKQHDWPLEALLEEAQLRLAYDGCARADETNALAVTDISADGMQMAFWPHGFTHLKREWNHRTIDLRLGTTAVALAAKEALRRQSERSQFLFSQQGGLVDLRIGRAMQTRLSGMLRTITCNSRFVWHALRGAGLMQRLAPEWELDLQRYIQGPLLLRHARSLVDKMAGASVNHLARSLGYSGHLSPGVPIRHYLTSWPYWYAMAMRATLADQVRVSPDLADAVPGANRALLSTANCRFRNDGVVDDWAWLIKQLHFRGWRQDRDPLKHQVLPEVKPAKDDTPLPLINSTRYLLLRTLHVDTQSAAHMARIAHGRALRLEPAGALLRRFEEVHQPADGSEAGDVMRASTLNALETPSRRALLSSLVFAPEAARTVLRQWLDGIGPEPSADRARAILQCLPAELGLDFHGGLDPPLIELGGRLRRPKARTEVDLDRVRVQPRLRLFQLHDARTDQKAPSRRPNDHRAAVLSALARLTLQINPPLIQPRSN